MNLDYRFYRTPSTMSGEGALGDLPRILRDGGYSRILLVTSRSFLKKDVCADFFGALESFGVSCDTVTRKGEPLVSTIDEIADNYRFLDGLNAAVVAVGGGSTIDTGKAVSAMIPAGGSVSDFLEGIGSSKLLGRKLFFAAVPTTSGTGAEATKNAVVKGDIASSFKKSLRHDSIVPDVAVLDPRVTAGCPFEVKAFTGMDTLSQLLGAYMSTRASAITDSLCEKGLMLFAWAFEKSLDDNPSMSVLSSMQNASFLSGLCLANAGLGIVHGIAGPAGGLVNAPHGALCGSLLKPAIEKNIHLLEKKGMNNSDVMKKYVRAGAILCGATPGDGGKVENLIEMISKWTSMCKLPTLSSLGFDNDLIRKTAAASGQKNNPVDLDKNDITSILMERF